ncbi:MAG TPA: hypothetical protein PLI56_07240 [Exilispira sp.]|nr:hypothetical protein [Exilispira sp.]
MVSDSLSRSISSSVIFKRCSTDLALSLTASWHAPIFVISSTCSFSLNPRSRAA